MVSSLNVQRVVQRRFDHDIELNDKHITGLIDPESPSGAVTKQYSDSKLALAVNELIRKIYLNTASLSNLQTDIISRIEAQSSAAASGNSIQDEKIQEMLGKNRIERIRSDESSQRNN